MFRTDVILLTIGMSGGWLEIGRAVHLLFQKCMELMITLLTCFPVNPTGLTNCDDNV